MARHRDRYAIAMALLSLFCIAMLIATHLRDQQIDQALVQPRLLDIRSTVHRPTFAYVTFLCDDELLASTRVWVHSLKQTSTLHDIVVMTLPKVSEIARAQLQQLGAIIHDITHISYPFDDVKYEPGINKQCRYSKLHIFNMTSYDKVVYLDADTMAIENIDELFALPAFSAVKDMGGAFNTGMMVIQPSTDVFERMLETHKGAPSYNKGDQGFINWFFNFTSAAIVPTHFNVVAKLNEFALGRQIVENAKVFHFTSETKPWSYHQFHHKDWKRNMHPGMFASWWKNHHAVQQLLHHGVWNDTAKFSIWPLKDRVETECQQYRPRFEDNGAFPIQDKFSVSISTYSPERTMHVRRLVLYYLASDLVDKVYVIWHDPKVPVHRDLVDLAKRNERFVASHMKTDTLNNRFTPLRGLRTQAVFICDDDILLPLADIHLAFTSWAHRPDAIHGFFPRIHSYDGRKATYDMAGVKHAYSMILTKAMFINAHFLFAYTCMMQHEVHAYVDEHSNCEDIAMNMLISGTTNNPPVLVDTAQLYDFGTKRGISASDTHIRSRADCVRDLIRMFWGDHDPLMVSREIVRRYRTNKFEKVDWARFDAVLARLEKRDA